MTSGEGHEARLRIGREGISRTLTDRLRLKDNPRGAGGLYISTLANLVLSLDGLLDRPRIDFDSVSVSAGNGTYTIYTVAEDTQEDWLALEWQGSGGTVNFDHQLSVVTSSRDGGTSYRLADATAGVGSALQRLYFGQPMPVNPGWQLKTTVTNYVSGANVVARVWKRARTWMHYDES